MPCPAQSTHYSPPSSMAWQAEPYRLSIAAVHSEAIDLTSALSRDGGGASRCRRFVGAGARAGLNYSPCDREKDLRPVVIVGDTFSTGNYGCRRLSYCLREHGLPPGLAW